LRLREAIRLSDFLYRELVYLRMVSTRANVDMARLRRGVRWASINYALVSAIMTVMLALSSISPLLPLIWPPQDTAGGVELVDALRASGLVSTAMLFTFSFMLCASASWLLQEYELLKPLMHLPLKHGDIRLLAFITASREVLPFLLVPAIHGITLMLVVGLPAPALIGASYGYASIFLALGASFSLSATVSRRHSGRSLRARLARAVSTLTFVLCMASTFILSQMVSLITRLVSQISKFIGPFSSLLWLIYPFSAAEGLIMALSPTSLIPASALAAAYLLASLLAFDRGFMRFWRGSISPIYVGVGEAREVRIRPPSKLTMSPCFGVLLKDLKMAYRDPRTAYMLFTPILTFLSFLPALIEDAKAAIMLLNTAFLASSLMLTMASYQLLVAEGSSFWLLFANGIRKKDLISAKALACTLSYAALAIPIGALAWLLLGPLDMLLNATSSVLLSFAASSICLAYLARYVGPETKMAKMGLKDLLVILLLWGIIVGPYALVALIIGPLQASLIAIADLGIALIVLSTLH